MSEETEPYDVEGIPAAGTMLPIKSERPGTLIQQNPYVGASVTPVSQEQQDILLEAIEEEEHDILPTGEVYVSQVRYRRILNRAFGPGGWALVPRGPLTIHENILYREYALYAGGRFISEAPGEQEYFANNSRMSYATAAESVKSNALMRCCKDLGIASECWDRRFCEMFKAENCIKVWVLEKGQPKARWRRKDAAPLTGEKGLVGSKEEPAEESSGNGHEENKIVLPNFGKQAGRSLDDPEITETNLRFYLHAAEQSIDDPKKATYKARNEKLRDAIQAELQRRQAPSPAQAETPTTTTDAFTSQAGEGLPLTGDRFATPGEWVEFRQIIKAPCFTKEDLNALEEWLAKKKSNGEFSAKRIELQMAVDRWKAKDTAESG